MIRSFRGARPAVSASAYIDPSAVLIGEITVGDRSSVWCNVTVRADTSSVSIGDDTNIQDNSCLHEDADAPLRIGDRVVVGHSCTVHGCDVGDDCLVGMGSTILSKARIGAGSIVAAGAVVLGGTDVPPRSLVAGVPAKVKRSVTDAEVERTRENAAHYVELTEQHRNEA
jgi:carbonic anhydrase/acetyltransferase-like protein (isoleucine patch superfamily)